VESRLTSTIAGDDPEADADGSPEFDVTIDAAAAAADRNVEAYKELMDLGEEEELDARRRRRDMRTNSLNSQDMEEIFAAASSAQGDDFPVTQGANTNKILKGPKRYKNSVAPNPGGSVGSFPVHMGNADLSSSGHPRPFTPSQAASTKFISASIPSSQSQNSRGFVFRNTDAADMEAHAQARSPLAEHGHRSSLSGGSHSGVTSQLSPPTPAPPVTMQFLPPQSGPPQPKKIYHNKGTGQVIGSHNAGMSSSLAGPIDPGVHGPGPVVGVPVGVQGSMPGAIGNPPSRQGSSAGGPSTMMIDGMPKRTCKQCGQPGRYKDNKCVEKWGPGPQGPGTVCDRCRKKMKRVEKRATQDSTVVAAAALAHAHNAGANHHPHPYPLAPAPSNNSFSQLTSQVCLLFQQYDG
jgi:hypothetical protein